MAETLTGNKTGDKEKFDAIFAWVASNISYDFKAYYSPSGTGVSNLRRVLKSRKGICIDYANLMDTLCALSQLTNVSIYGYTKDDIFDVNDSIYMDNHVWNAVKLDGLWYLYDVTWAAGDVEYRFTRFSRFILKLSDKFPEAYKRKKAKQDKRKSTYKCNEPDEPVYYYAPRKFNRFVKRLLWLIPLRVKKYFIQNINDNFYLTDPKVFAITHFPDNPDWSFLTGLTMRHFETDSLFYHLTDSSYRFQNKHGTACEACENELLMDNLNKQQYLRSKSLAFNKNNRFISSHCEYSIANLHFNESLTLTDSLAKIKSLDTSSAYFQLTQTSLKACRGNINKEFRLQKNKNKYKQTMLLKDNRKHIDFVKDKINLTYMSNRICVELSNKYKTKILSYSRRKSKIQRLKTVTFVNKSGKESAKKMLKLNERLAFNERETDSIQLLIKQYKNLFDSISKSLSFNIWQKVLQHKMLIAPIIESIQLRERLKDNFKKTVVESRKQLNIYEENYSRDVTKNVYEPCMKLYLISNALLKLLDMKAFKEMEVNNLKMSLVKFNQLPVSVLSDYKEALLMENKNDYCWLKGNIPELNSILVGFESLLKEQNSALKTIVYENAIERSRASQVNSELLRRKTKYQNIVSHNTYLTRVKLKDIKKEKSHFLNLLKAERRVKDKKRIR